MAIVLFPRVYIDIIRRSGEPCCFQGSKKMWQIPHSKDAAAHQFPSRWRRPHPAGPAEARQGHWSWSSATWLWRKGRARQQTLGWQERGAQPDRGICKRATKKQEKWRRRRSRVKEQEEVEKKHTGSEQHVLPAVQTTGTFCCPAWFHKQFVEMVLLLFPVNSWSAQPHIIIWGSKYLTLDFLDWKKLLYFVLVFFSNVQSQEYQLGFFLLKVCYRFLRQVSC